MSDRDFVLLIRLTCTRKAGFSDMFCLHAQENSVFCACFEFMHSIAVLLCVLLMRLPQFNHKVFEPCDDSFLQLTFMYGLVYAQEFQAISAFHGLIGLLGQVLR